MIATNVKCNGRVIFSNNVASLGTIYLLNSLVTLMGNFNSTNNLGSIFAHNTILKLKGCTTVVNCSSVRLNLVPRFSQGGAITAHKSEVNIHGRCILMYNQTDNGGGVYANESSVCIQPNSCDFKEQSKHGGGGIFFHLSELHCQLYSILKISNNSASQKGGEIHTISSMINVYLSYNEDCIEASVFSDGNQANLGGAACLDTNTKFYILKRDWSRHLHFSIKTLPTMEEHYSSLMKQSLESMQVLLINCCL